MYRNILGVKIGKNTCIYHGAQIRSPKKIRIGANTIIGEGAVLDGRGGLEIGDNVNFSSGVWVWTMQHDPHCPDFGIKDAPVVIEDYAWLSCRTVVLPGIRVGKGAVLAAGAVATKDIPPFKIAAGIPAKVIGDRKCQPKYTLGGGMLFW
jgi:acetyltransferase-like isoleucine patch superfamily enzyme